MYIGGTRRIVCINLQLRGGVHWRDKEDVMYKLAAEGRCTLEGQGGC